MDTEQEIIKETPWKQAVNGLYDIKHLWAVKNGTIYIVVAHRTYGVGFNMLPIEKLVACEFKVIEPIDTEEEARQLIKMWLESKS